MFNNISTMGYFIEVEKLLGIWTNYDGCVATGNNATCGPGNQRQTRTCTDGTTEKCSIPADTQQTISCSAAQTALPECPGRD